MQLNLMLSAPPAPQEGKEGKEGEEAKGRGRDSRSGDARKLALQVHPHPLLGSPLVYTQAHTTASSRFLSVD